VVRFFADDDWAEQGHAAKDRATAAAIMR
jgi:hypothetical protein